MAVTLQDAIEGWIRYHQAQANPIHAKTFNDSIKIWIDTLRAAPTDLGELEIQIANKKRRIENEVSAALTWRIHTSIEAMEWVKGQILCEDFEVWAKASGT